MTQTALAVLALFAALQDEAPRAPDEAALRKQLQELEARLPDLDRRIREAVEQDDAEAARRLTREHRETRKEIENLQDQIRKLEEARTPEIDWYRNFNLEAQVRLTHWDNDLELEDGVGWGAALYLRHFIFFEYRRWEGEDELSDADAEVSSYQLGFTHEFSVEREKTSAFIIGGGLGLIHCSTDAPGRDNDTGPIVSISPQWKFYFSPRTRFTLGGDIDIFRTDFNQNHTHTNHTFSLLLSMERAF